MARAADDDDDLSAYLADVSRAPGIGAEQRVYRKKVEGVDVQRLKSEHGSSRYRAFADGEPVSALQVVSRDGYNAVIANVYTKPAFRRKGYAAALLAAARKDFRKVEHASEGNISSLGKRWRDGVERANPPRERKPCIAPHADIVKDDALWARCEYVGIQEDYDDAGERADLALANCTCGSTLSRPAPKRNPVPRGATIWFGAEQYDTVEEAVAAAIDALDRSRGGRRNQPRDINLLLPSTRHPGGVVTVDSSTYEDEDDCLTAAANDYAEQHGLDGWDLSPRWGDDQRETIELDVPESGDDAEEVTVARVERHATRRDRYTLVVLDPDRLPTNVWTMHQSPSADEHVRPLRALVGVVAGPGVTHPDDAQPTAAHAPYVFNVDTDWDPPITNFYTAVADAIARLRSSSDTTPVDIEYGERARDDRGNAIVEPLGVVAWVAPFDAASPNLLRLYIEHPGLVPGEVTTGDADERARKMRQWQGCQDVHSVDVQWSQRAAGPAAPTSTMTANEEARGLIAMALHLANWGNTLTAAETAMVNAVENEMAIRHPGSAFAVVELYRALGPERFEYEVQRNAGLANFHAVDRDGRPYSLQRPPATWVRVERDRTVEIPIQYTTPLEPTQLELAIMVAIGLAQDRAAPNYARDFVAAVWEQMMVQGSTLEGIAAYPLAFGGEARTAASIIAGDRPDRWVWRRRVNGNFVEQTFARGGAEDATPAGVGSRRTGRSAQVDAELAAALRIDIASPDRNTANTERFIDAVFAAIPDDMNATRIIANRDAPGNRDRFNELVIAAAQSIASVEATRSGGTFWTWTDRPGHTVAIGRTTGTRTEAPRAPQDFTRQPDRVPEAARPIAEAMTSTRPPEPPRPITEWTSPEDAMRRRFEQLEPGDPTMGLSPLDHSILLRGNLPLNTRVRLRRTVLRSEPEHKQFARGSAGRVIFNNNDGPFVVVKLDNDETVEWDAIHFEQMAGDLEVEPEQAERYRGIETRGKSALGRSLLEQSERFRAALHVGERVRLRRPVLRGHEQFKRGAAGEVITNDADPTGQRFVTVRLDQGLLVEWGPTHLEQLAGDLELEPEQASRYRAIELNPALRNNPAWVTGILAKHFELLESKVPARWLPRLTDAKAKGGKLTAALKEYGCGAYGCVLPTLDPKVVLKVTTDDTEYQFANELAGDLAVQVTVDYHLVAALPEKRGGRATYLLWRDAAEHVGKVNEVLGRGERGAQAVEDAINDQHAAAQKAFVDLMEGRDAKKSLAKWEAACNEMGRLVPELRELADGMIRNLHESGVYVSDVHSGNIGLVGDAWLIVDPGNVAKLDASGRR